MANIIFDFDGTIADSFDYVFGFLCREAGKSTDFVAKEAESYRRLSMKDIALRLGIPLWRLPYIYFKGRRVMRRHVAHVRPFHGVPELIADLKTAGHHLNIISANSGRNIRIFLKENKLADDFTVVQGGTGLIGKVIPIRRLRRKFKVEPCWYIGDEVSDMLSATAAGVRKIGVTWGFAGPEELRHCHPDAIVDTPAEIPTIIRQSIVEKRTSD
jgi:phosphoglycolate phosphatase